MPPSTILQLLIQLQTDLNELTLCCVEANSSVTDILALYNGQAHRRSEIAPRVKKWTRALDVMADSLEKFQQDADTLGEYLDAQG